MTVTRIAASASSSSVPLLGGTFALGSAIPTGAHAVSVSLPAWQDNVDYEEGRSRVVNAMQTGYPRFFVHRSIQKLAGICEERFAPDGTECCYLFPSRRVAQSCTDFLASRSPPVPSRIAALDVPVRTADDLPTVLYAVLLAVQHRPIGKQFWQHTGDGISSRLAVRCLEQLGYSPLPMPSSEATAVPSSPSAAAASKEQRGYSRNRHYAKASSVSGSPESSLVLSTSTDDNPDAVVYVEERYGRNLQATLGPIAKQALRRRIAGVLRDTSAGDNGAEPSQTLATASDRGVPSLFEDDVFLFPSGMSAIFHAHQTALAARAAQGKPVGLSICFGFPYTDTLKILEKWGPGCLHFGHGTEADMNLLESHLAQSRDRQEDPCLALFCEFPSNPLLRSPNLHRLRQLADKYDFLIVVDETIGTFHNVEVLPLADIVVSSLTKVFSGEANVVAGSMVVNPRSVAHRALHAAIEQVYEDNLYNEDAIFVERNSRDFAARIERSDANAEQLCEYLQTRATVSGSVIKSIHYPKYETATLYRACARTDATHPEPRYGSLFSITFRSQMAAEVFYDALCCCKGPSLGTNFTLASPYTLLAHYNELAWAAQWGVESTLVRVSVGLEPGHQLLDWFGAALDRATEA